MWPVVSQLAAIASLRAGPRTLTASWPALAAVLVLDLTVNGGALLVIHPPATVAWLLAASAALALAFVYAAVSLRGMKERFLQTATALVGVDLVVSVVALPLALTRIGLSADAPAAPEIALAFLVVLVWYLIITGRVFKEALELPTLAALPVALAYWLATSGSLFSP